LGGSSGFRLRAGSNDRSSRRRTGRRAVLVAGLALAAALTITPAATAATATFYPTADAYVSSVRPEQNYGWSPTYRLDGSPVRRAYLRFNVVLPIGAVVTRTTLRLNFNYPSSSGFSVVTGASNTWDEQSLTFVNRPLLTGTTQIDVPSIASGWNSVALPPIQPGQVTFALTRTSAEARSIYSKEAALDPQLVVDYRPHAQLTPPLRAAFYYPWFPETWTVNGAHVFYRPLRGYYDSSSTTVVDDHIRALTRAKTRVAIASWWGSGTHDEARRINLLLDRTQALGSGLRVALYHEQEGYGNPSISEIRSDLAYAKRYAEHPAYAYVNGKPVIFVYSAGDISCELADRWRQAAGDRWYVSLKVFPGYQLCSAQPDTWHQYAPALVTDRQPGYSYAISPGFWRADELAPRLGRDLLRWKESVRGMVASGDPWQLVTTFNEWGEGTAIEEAAEWQTAGDGTYLDALATDGR
jgi:Glycosyl hydrolase family 99